MVLTGSDQAKKAMVSEALSSHAEHGGGGRPIPVDSSGGGSGRSRRSGSRRAPGSPSSGGDSLFSPAGNPLGSSSEIPPSIEDDYWGGVATGTGLRCHHGLRPRRKMCWDGKNTGRCFLGCGLEEEGKQCRFVHWYDAEHSLQVQTAILALWDVVAVFNAREAAARKEKRRAWKVAVFFAVLLVASVVRDLLK